MDLESLVAELGDLAAGGSFEGSSSPAQRRHFQRLARDRGDGRVRVLEIGFNVGAGSAAFLTASPTTEVVALDLGSHEYVAPCSAHVAQLFGPRFELILGDSRQTLPRLVAERGAWADVVLVDGGHTEEICRADLDGAARAAVPGATVIVDDLLPDRPWGEDVQRVWDDLVGRGVLVDAEVWRSVDGVDEPLRDAGEPVEESDRRWGVARFA